jgi:hypothetical protein
MANLATQNVLGGHTAEIVIDGQTVGWVQGLTWSRNLGPQAVKVVGEVEAQEHQQTSFDVQGELTRYYVRDMLVNSGKLDGRTAADCLSNGTVDFVVKDKTTKKPIITLEGCTLATDSCGVQANQLVSKRLTFLALRTR